METIKNNNYTKQLCKAFHLWSALKTLTHQFSLRHKTKEAKLKLIGGRWSDRSVIFTSRLCVSNEELYQWGCPDLTLPTGAELLALQSSPAAQLFLKVFTNTEVFTNGLLQSHSPFPLQLLCCQVKWSPFLRHRSGWNTCDQTAAGQLSTCIFHKSPPASHHHPNECYWYLQITNSWLRFFPSYLSLPGRGLKGGKPRVMWLIKGKNLYLSACKGSCWYTRVKAKSNAVISCHLTETKTSGNKI